MWYVSEVSEVTEQWRTSTWHADMDHADGEIDDLTHRRELNRIDKELDENIEWLKAEAWAAVGHPIGE